jgi:uncharacterized membrane protein YraQ (UPF0718 family)
MRLQWHLVVLFALTVIACLLLWNVLDAVFTLVAVSAPYLLVGFVLAGFIKALLPEHKIYHYLGGNQFTAVALASLLGVPIPLCSCSVLPVAMSLRRSGASKGATTAFLISTPETGVDSIGITYALLDPLMTIARPLAALLTALGTGTCVNLLVRQGWDRDPEGLPPDTASRLCHDHTATAAPASSKRYTLRSLMREALCYAFGPLMDDLAPWFLVGFFVSGVVVLVIPADFFGSVIPTGWASSLLMVLVGTPIYICAAAATPVAVSLIVKGLDPGAALVLLLVGPATNATTMFVIARLLGRRVLAVHLVGVISCALILGALLNMVYTTLGSDLSTLAAGTVTESVSLVSTLAALVLFAFLCSSVIRIRLIPRSLARLKGVGRRLGSASSAPPAS